MDTALSSATAASIAKDYDLLLAAIKHNLKAAADFAFQHSCERFSATLNQANSSLKQAARDTQDNSEKEAYILAMEACNKQQSQMLYCFQQELLQSYRILIDDEPSLKQQHTELVSEDVEQRSRIFVHQLIADSQRFFDKNISSSTKALKQILPLNHINAHNNPFAPNVLIEACYKSISQTGLSSQSKQYLLLHFQHQWFVKMGGFYQNLAERLRLAGVQSASIPEPTRQNLQNHSFRLDTVEVEAFTGESNFHDKEHVLQSNEVSDAIGLIQGTSIPPAFSESNYLTMEDTAPAQHQVLTNSTVINLIGNMQKGYEPESDGDVIRYIKKEISLSSKPHMQFIVSRTQENTINLISLSFSILTAQLSPKIAKLILRLKPAYARIALSDDIFFHDSLHPARRLLDILLELINGPGDDSMIARYVQKIVMKVQLRFKGDTDLFEELYADVENYIHTEQKQSEANQARLINQFSEQENMDMAIQACQTSLSALIQPLNSALEFFDFFIQLLSPALAEQYLQHGSEGEYWLEINKDLQTLFSIMAMHDSVAIRSEIKTLTDINQKISHLLNAYKTPPADKQILLDQLQDLQIMQMQGKHLISIYDSQLKHHQKISEYLQQHHAEKKASEQSQFIGYQHCQLKTAKYAQLVEAINPAEAKQCVENLAIGDWISIMLDQQVNTIQYGFFSRSRDSFIFFNRLHEKAFERNKGELIKDFASGFACKVEAIANFDTALLQVSKKITHKY